MKVIGVLSLLAVTLFVVTGFNSNPPSPVFVDEYIGQLKFIESRVLQLEEAVPQDKYSYRPAEGVRSVSEVYLHIAQANYLFVALSGGKLPEGLEMDQKKYEMQTMDKAKIAELIKTSFAFATEYVKKLNEEDLNKEIEAFGMKFSVRNFMVTMLSHTHEHLGQAIAYARINGVTPPWSME
ncbi:MAG: DinB family protein [Ignavibacteriales bacterium]|nr:MAG: DinB family protein [Ignavibacteriales bacterium]